MKQGIKIDKDRLLWWLKNHRPIRLSSFIILIMFSVIIMTGVATNLPDTEAKPIFEKIGIDIGQRLGMLFGQIANVFYRIGATVSRIIYPFNSSCEKSP